MRQSIPAASRSPIRGAVNGRRPGGGRPLAAAGLFSGIGNQGVLSLVGIQRKCAKCEEEEAALQPKPEAGAPRPVQTPSIVRDVLRSPGRPMESETRSFMESRLGHDLGRVRLHTGGTAADSARALNAHAYTVRENIVFGPGRYSPHSESGKRLLVHELTHVIQQRLRPPAPGLSRVGDPAEREADLNADSLFTRRGMSFGGKPSAMARNADGPGETTVTVTEPTGPGACDLEKHNVIEPAVRMAQQWLDTAVSRLDDFLRSPGDASNAGTRQSLDRHFHSTSAATARTVRGRLDTLRTDMVGRQNFTVECHTASDTSCTNTAAYVQGGNFLVFCPNFFESSSDEWRAGALIHEMAHSLVGLGISDRAYQSDRLLPLLSTAEALDNAESYTLFVQELATGRTVEGDAPEDNIEDCPAATRPLIREALGRAQRWNRDAEVVAVDSRPAMISANAGLFNTHLGSSSPATRTAAADVYKSMVTRLKSSIDVRCDKRAGRACGSRQAYKRSGRESLGRRVGIGAGIGAGVGLAGGIAAGLLLGLGAGLAVGLAGLAAGALIGLIAGANVPDRVHVCPTWASQNADRRAESLLAAIYETYAGLSPDQSQKHAALARALHVRFIGTPEPT